MSQLYNWFAARLHQNYQLPCGCTVALNHARGDRRVECGVKEHDTWIVNCQPSKLLNVEIRKADA